MARPSKDKRLQEIQKDLAELKMMLQRQNPMDSQPKSEAIEDSKPIPEDEEIDPLVEPEETGEDG